MNKPSIFLGIIGTLASMVLLGDCPAPVVHHHYARSEVPHRIVALRHPVLRVRKPRRRYRVVQCVRPAPELGEPLLAAFDLPLLAVDLPLLAVDLPPLDPLPAVTPNSAVPPAEDLSAEGTDAPPLYYYGYLELAVYTPSPIPTRRPYRPLPPRRYGPIPAVAPEISVSTAPAAIMLLAGMLALLSGSRPRDAHHPGAAGADHSVEQVWRDLAGG